MKKEKKEQRERARFNEKCKEIENKLSMFERLE
jgi:hypothetical protein